MNTLLLTGFSFVPNLDIPLLQVDKTTTNNNTVMLFLLFILFFILLTVGLFRMRIKQIKEKELVRLIEEKTKELNTTMNEMFAQNQKLQSVKSQEEEANNLKSAILSKISHELRTPMNNILGFAHLLALKAGETDTKKMAEDILNSGSKLMETFDALIELAYIEKTSGILNQKEISLEPFLENIAKKHQDAAKNKAIDFSLSSLNELFIYANEATFTRALDNIIENAIKFTSAGTVSVKSSLLEEKSNKWALIEISDTGAGIPDQDIEKIFEPFKSGYSTLKAGFKGSGLNLVYSKRIIDLLKGNISVESKTGYGTTFTIKIPLSTRLHLEPDLIMVKKSSEDDKRPLTEILLVEDNIMNKELITLYLKGLYKTDYAPDGYWALRMCAKKQYSAILMDINLKSDMDGLQTTSEIRKIPGFENIPIAAVTGYTSPDDLEKIEQSQCTHYLAKPFDSKQLLDLMTEMMGSSSTPKLT